MNIDTIGRTILAIACLVSVGCQKRVAEKDTLPFRIIATDAGFEAPDRVAAGLRHIIFENRGSEIHESMLVKLPKGTAADDYAAAVRAGSLFPEGALDYSGVGLTSPGETAEMWLKVDPGQYVLICWNFGHARTTPLHPFTVVGDIFVDDKVPKEEIVLRLSDYKFELEGNLHKGTQVIRVENSGPTMHEVDFFRLHEGKTIDDLRRWRKDKAGAAPADALGGALDSHDLRKVVWLRKNLSPGHYVLHCEMPVTTNAFPSSQELTHADLGMVREIEIKE